MTEEKIINYANQVSYLTSRIDSFPSAQRHYQELSDLMGLMFKDKSLPLKKTFDFKTYRKHINLTADLTITSLIQKPFTHQYYMVIKGLHNDVNDFYRVARPLFSNEIDYFVKGTDIKGKPLSVQVKKRI